MMSQESMRPLGLALLDYYNGDTGAVITLHRNDGEVGELPVAVFFRESSAMLQDKTALDNCRGRVLDVGAGSGLHSLYLQEKGFSVCAMDISPEVCDVMRKRGVKEVWCGNISEIDTGPFDTLLILGRSIGMVEDIAGLERFLTHTRRLVNPGGQIVMNSADVRKTENPVHLAYHEQNRRDGRYIGELKITLEYKGKKGPETGMLHVDPETLAARAEEAGWDCEILMQEEDGGYVARLTVKDK